METKPRPLRLDDEALEWFNALPGKTANDKMRGLMSAPATTPDNRLDEILEHVRSMAVEAVMQRKIDERKGAASGPGFNPASIPGVQVGARTAAPAKYQREDGSAMNWAERREVDHQAHLRELAAQDPTAAAVERDDVVYDS